MGEEYFDYSSSPTGYITNLLSSISVPVPYLNGGNPGYADYYFNFTTLQGQSSSSVARLSRIDFPKAKITDSNNLFMSFSYYSHDPSIPGFDEKGSALQRITYPTGGYTQYDYASYIYDFNTSYYPKPDTQQPGQSVKVKWVGGFGVTTVKKNDGTNNTVRQWERFDMQYINPNSTTCDDFGFAQETLPDGQKILHLYKIPTSKQGGAGYELYTLYFANDSALVGREPAALHTIPTPDALMTALPVTLSTRCVSFQIHGRGWLLAASQMQITVRIGR